MPANGQRWIEPLGAEPDKQTIHFERHPEDEEGMSRRYFDGDNVLECHFGKTPSDARQFAERDPLGRPIWKMEGKYERVLRQRNGHFLAFESTGAGRVVELDNSLKVVWGAPLSFGLVSNIRPIFPTSRMGFGAADGPHESP
jgi:hypothetical protein